MTDRADAGWPPQPRGISAVVSKSDPAGEARAREELQRATRAAERAALARADVRAALGRRYERIGLRRASGKHGTTGPAQLVFFSHDRRATVEVAVDDPAGATVRVTPATEYQPEITDEEIAAAGKLARAHFLALGRERVAALQAFGILAYEPRGRGFYPTRVLYISFHEDAEAPPEFAAWVDLTRERVLRIREESR